MVNSRLPPNHTNLPQLGVLCNAAQGDGIPKAARCVSRRHRVGFQRVKCLKHVRGTLSIERLGARTRLTSAGAILPLIALLLEEGTAHSEFISTGG